ncbi:MAG: GHMP kinase [Ardenticatenaceae bacterium]
MYQIIQISSHNLPDVRGFIETLNRLDGHPTGEARGLFERGAELVVTRAPGRLDVMGGIADYSGSLVLQLPLREATLVALQRDSSRVLRIVSLGAEGNERSVSFEMPLAEFERDGKPVDYAQARAYFGRDARSHWAAYVAGVFLVLMRECGATFSEGARILIRSDVPEGKGVSSSAALEVAVMQAVAAAYAIRLEAREMALLCQKVENLVVGAPCGVMDQMTASCGQSQRLLALLCQPAELQGMVTIPDEIALWGLDSGVRHFVSGADYGSVRVGAFMGYRIIAEAAGLTIKHPQQAPDSPLQISDPHWGGYLANISPSVFAQQYAAILPEQMSGADFLAQYANTTDLVTKVEPTQTYAVRTPTAHPIYEHFRVRSYAELLNQKVSERQLQLLGELMYQSHASYSACGLGSQGTDQLVELVRAAGPQQGLYGAKITGGGSGGTVAVLGRRGADAAIQAIAQQYAQHTGHQPYIFAGSSLGAAAFGYLRLRGE